MNSATRLPKEAQTMASDVLGVLDGPIDREIARILRRALDGEVVSREDALRLCGTQGRDLQAVAATADELRLRQAGDVVTYVVNRNINFTNVCIKHCSFCAFSRDYREEQGYFLPIDEILRRAREAVAFGATEVCLQAGLPPKMDGRLYIDLTRTLKRELPQLHLHAFSPEEVLYGAIRSNVSVRDYLVELKAAGLDTLPGTSAEILDQEIRDRIAPGRISVKQWIEVITAAHALGIRTTATIMYGHIETPLHWVRHLDLLRDIQHETHGFTEFVPLSFVHDEAPMFRRGLQPGVRRGASGADVVRMHAVARLMLGPSFRNIQTSWVKEGPKVSQLMLAAGANDLGGTLMNESISTSAGARYGQMLAPAELRRIIRDIGRIPSERSTLYTILRNFADGDGGDHPLDRVDDPDHVFGSYDRLAGSGDFRYTHPSAKSPGRTGA
jgi:7,8-didemethyl-8-hydroxy-5-deazariboflavin synthase CofH subunit